MSKNIEMNFPKVSGSNLNGRTMILPDDFKGDLNIIIIAFKRVHTELIEGWTSSLENLAKNYPELTYWELPVLSNRYSVFRWWIDGGMRTGIIDNKAREQTITLYIDKRNFKKELEIPNEETICLLLVDGNGKVIWRAEGAFTEKKLQSLKRILEKATAKERK
jgi:hypothetical protein